MVRCSSWLCPLGYSSVSIPKCKISYQRAKRRVPSRPLDTIKSKIQADAFPSQGDKKKYYGVIDCARKTFATQGAQGFFKGIVPTLIRSPFANGATFAAFELTMKFIS